MSRERDNYENSGWRRFERWMEGETDPLQGRVEVKRPGQETKKVVQIPIDYQKIEEAVYNTDKNLNMKFFRVFYKVMSAILCFGIIAVLLWTVSYLPVTGNPSNPNNNEVSARYIESGLQETGAVNVVTGMILDYRAFDTFGESCVLFIASCCVLILLRIDLGSSSGQLKRRLADADDRYYASRRRRRFSRRSATGESRWRRCRFTASPRATHFSPGRTTSPAAFRLGRPGPS